MIAPAPGHWRKCAVCYGFRPVGAGGLMTPHGRWDESAADPATADLITCTGSGRQPATAGAA